MWLVEKRVYLAVRLNTYFFVQLAVIPQQRVYLGRLILLAGEQDQPMVIEPYMGQIIPVLIGWGAGLTRLFSGRYKREIAGPEFQCLNSQ